jgi:K+-sensing histidine kinase KdpD
MDTPTNTARNADKWTCRAAVRILHAMRIGVFAAQIALAAASLLALVSVVVFNAFCAFGMCVSMEPLFGNEIYRFDIAVLLFVFLVSTAASILTLLSKRIKTACDSCERRMRKTPNRTSNQTS